MGFDRNAPKRATNMTLNEDLVRRSRQFTSNLSDTVEELLARFLEQCQREMQERDADTAEFVELHNSVVARHPDWAERLW